MRFALQQRKNLLPIYHERDGRSCRSHRYRAVFDKPNILVIWGDDVGVHNISAYNHGIMGYQTPNIDRIAREGALFTDAYAQQSCTAGRASFITGQHPFRTGLLTIGMPGSPHGIPDWTPTIADLLKEEGYATAQFGKNHLGDQDNHLPTNHGFDEFYGNLYHLNAEEEPETYYYPQDPEFRERYGPRGVIRSSADGAIEDTGPMTRQRMETADEEFLAAGLDFMERSVEQDTPFFMWFNTTRMHVWTRLKPEAQGRTGIGLYPDGMVEHDDHVGMLLDKLEELGVDENTIVIYSTDNGAEKVSWPDGGITPFHGEKGTTWEGGFRVPKLVRWPGTIEPGTVINDIISQEDWMPTLLAAAGEPDVVEEAQGRLPGQRHGMARASRWLQLHAVLCRRDRRGAEVADLLFRSGRRSERGALERLEDPLRAAGGQHRHERADGHWLANDHQSARGPL
jgi:arylsulfatase A-like enzyme